MLSAIVPVLYSVATLAVAAPPNVVLVVVDDFGYGDLGCYGGRDIPTPNIDALAANGVRFTDGYSVCPLCAPSRAGIMTGKYPQRFGFEFIGDMRDPHTASVFGLPTDQIALPERLKALGYRNSMVGKWHLGERWGTTPMDRGFHSFLGFLGGALGYITKSGTRTLNLDYGTIEVPGYLTDIFNRRATNFVRYNPFRPFFLYLAYNAVHKPYQSTDKYLKRVAHLPPSKRTYAAMMSAVDDGIGMLRNQIRESGLENNTLFILVSDNGGLVEDGGVGDNGPLRSGKRYMFEGGVRVPFLMSWPARLPKGAVYTNPVSTLDIVPTVMAATGNSLSGTERTDGVNLIPHVRGIMTNKPHEELFWRKGDSWAIRSGDHKLVQSYTSMLDTDLTYGLYNLSEDVGETLNLRSFDLETARALRKRWLQWSGTLSDPLWGPLQ